MFINMNKVSKKKIYNEIYIVKKYPKQCAFLPMVHPAGLWGDRGHVEVPLCPLQSPPGILQMRDKPRLQWPVTL